MDEIRFGLIGAGRMSASMLAAFEHVPGARASAVVSSSKAAAERFANDFGIPKAHGSVDALLEDPQIDVVYIANPTECHAADALRALRAGKAVLCEKPLGTTAADAREIMDTARQTGRLCMEAMWTPFLPAYQRLFELYADPVLGAPQHLYADFGYPVHPDSHPRLFRPSAGAGVLLDRGVYPIYLALKLLGPVSDVSGRTVRSPEGVDTLATVELAHRNGGLSQLAVSLTGLMQNRAVLSLSRGSISLEAPVIGSENLRICRAQGVPHAPVRAGASLKQRLKERFKQLPMLRRVNHWRQSGRLEHHPYNENQYLPMLHHFCDLYRNGKTESDVVPLSLSMDVLRVVEQIRGGV